MSTKQAFTLLETLVVAALVVLVLTTAGSLRSTADSANQDISGMEEYYNQHSRLMNLLQHDLRSATSIRKISERNYEMACIHLDPDNNKPVRQTVGYRVTGADSLKVERQLNAEVVQTFDFSRFAKGRSFKFEIAIPD